MTDPGDRVAYKVIPMVGPDRNHLAQDDTHASDWSEEIDLTPEQSPHIGAYFNRGIVAAQWVSRKLNITDQNFKPAAAKKLTEVPIGASIVRPTETTPYSVHRAKSANRQGFPRRQNHNLDKL